MTFDNRLGAFRELMRKAEGILATDPGPIADRLVHAATDLGLAERYVEALPLHLQVDFAEIMEMMTNVELAGNGGRYAAAVRAMSTNKAVNLAMRGQGIPQADLIQIAMNLTFRPNVDSCIAGSKIVRLTGICAPGEVSSPKGVLPLLPTGSTMIGHGTLSGQGWAIAAGPLGGVYPPAHQYVEAQFFYGMQALQDPLNEVFIDTTKKDEGSIGVGTAINGDRFAYGIVPPSVTSVSGDSTSGHSLSLPVLTTRLHGEGFFVLYLGKVSSSYAYNPSPCPGVPVTVSFYEGSSKVMSIVFRADKDFSFSLGGAGGSTGAVGCGT